jgi:purine-binding chemotaxis protein CheW
VEKQFVIFEMDNENFGLAIDQVDSIIRCPQITRIPNALEYILGIFNLRGKIIPVVDLRTRLGLSETLNTKNTRVIITQCGENYFGLLVDSVNEVINLDSSAIEDVPELSSDIDRQFFNGVSKSNDRIIIFLSLEKVVNNERQLLIGSS